MKTQQMITTAQQVREFDNCIHLFYKFNIYSPFSIQLDFDY